MNALNPVPVIPSPPGSPALPPSPFLRTILTRATLVWAFLHAVSAVGLGAMWLSPAGALSQGIAAPWLWGVTAAAVVLAMHRRGETMLLANLGVSRRAILGLVLFWCVALEGALVAAVWLAG